MYIKVIYFLYIYIITLARAIKLSFPLYNKYTLLLIIEQIDST